MNKKGLFVFVILVLSGFLSFAQNNSDFDTGQALFRENKPEEAVTYLKSAITQGTYPKAYVYLSIVYYQLGLYQECLDICRDGMNVNGTDKKTLAFNAGNTAFETGDFESAERWYSLAIAANRLYAPPVLNRANAELKQEKYRIALEDYKLYLDLSPNDVQKEEIKKLIDILEGQIKLEDDRIAEEKRLAEEAERQRQEEERLLLLDLERQRQDELNARQAAAQEEMRNQWMEEQRRAMEEQREAMQKMLDEQRIAEEAARREAEENRIAEEIARRKKLLEDVVSSLKNTETENINAGAEGAIDYGYESELE